MWAKPPVPHSIQIKDPSKLFQKQALYGTARYRNVLKVLISSFYFNNSAKALREDASLYTLFGYLLFLRIDELGWPMFEKFVLSQEAVKMHVFLSYCYSFEMLNKWVKEEWCKVLDDDFVEVGLASRACTSTRICLHLAG